MRTKYFKEVTIMKLHGYMEVIEDLDDEFRGYCKDHNIEYKSVDNDGLYRLSGGIVSIMKLSHRMTKMHNEYLKKLEA